MQKIALLFPGQGSQHLGMGKDFYEQTDIGREVFGKFEKGLQRNLHELCFLDPEGELRSTVNAQPAIAAVSAAAYALFREKSKVTPSFVAGHSLGEYSALHAAGVISLEDLILLVDFRSKLMHSAKKGSMSAIIGLGEEKVRSILEKASPLGIIVVANCNSPSQIVVSGDEGAVNYASTSARKEGAIALPLAVSGAFHSPLMESFAKPLEELLEKIYFNDASFPVITNVDAVPTIAGHDFRRKLVKQLSSPVLWKQSIELMVNKGVDVFIEMGPQQVLSNLLRRWLPKITVYSIHDLPSLDSTLASLR